MIRALAFLALVLPVQAGAQEVRSLYTTHDWQTDCTAPDTDRPADEAGMGGRLVCPGPAGLSLMLAEGDARVSMDYGSTPEFGPWESFASFSFVHGTDAEGVLGTCREGVIRGRMEGEVPSSSGERAGRTRRSTDA
mgnify:CR=1 FL=1